MLFLLMILDVKVLVRRRKLKLTKLLTALRCYCQRDCKITPSTMSREKNNSNVQICCVGMRLMEI